MALTIHHGAATSAGGYPHALDGNQDPSDSGVAPNRDDYVWQLACAPSSRFKMVYSGTYEFHYLQSGPNFAPTTESATFTWTQTQTVTVSPAPSAGTEFESTTVLVASGHSSLDAPGFNVTCTIQTPQDYQRVAKSQGPRAPSSNDVQVPFLWSIESPPRPGTAGATGSAGNGAASGCQSSLLGFMASLGIPEPSTRGEQSVLEGAQSQTFQDAESGSVSIPVKQFPKTMHFDIDAQKSTTEFTITNAGTMTFHGTLTFSRVS